MNTSIFTDSNLSKAMDNPGTSSPNSVGHPGCHVCQGFGDLKNPRGRLFERAEKSCDNTRYYYVYMHYPNIGALLKSAEAGCGMCIKIREAFKKRGLYKFEAAAQSSLSEYDTDAQSDNNSTSTYDAEFAKPENVNPENFLFSGNSRITIHCDVDEKTGPRGKTGLYLLSLSTVFPGPTMSSKNRFWGFLSYLLSLFTFFPGPMRSSQHRFWGFLSYFNSCCVCNPRVEGGVVRQSLTKVQMTHLTLAWNTGLPEISYQKPTRVS